MLRSRRSSRARCRTPRSGGLRGVVLGPVASPRHNVSSKQRLGFLGQLACRVGGRVRGPAVSKAHLEGARGQLTDPHGVHSRRGSALAATVRRPCRGPIGLSTTARTAAAEVGTDLDGRPLAGPQAKVMRNADFGLLWGHRSPNPGWWSGAGSNRRHHDFQSCALPTELPDRAPGRTRACRTAELPPGTRVPGGEAGHVVPLTERADLTGFEPATSTLTGWRALQTAPQVHA